MISLHRPISNILLVVAFLVLASLAAITYNSNETSRAKIKDNIWYQKSISLWSLLSPLSQGIAQKNIQKSVGPGGQELIEGGTAAIKNSSFWSEFKDRLNKELNNEVVSSDNISSENLENKDQELLSTAENKLAKFFSYNKTAAGLELIFHFSQTKEQKFFIPLKEVASQK